MCPSPLLRWGSLLNNSTKMISAIISLVISLAILYIVYLLIQWVLGFIPIVPSVFTIIIKVVFGVWAFLIVLNFLAALLGSAGWQVGGYKLN